MCLPRVSIVCLASLFLGRAHAAFFYPDALSSSLEHILVDTHGAYSSGFADAITPCSNYVSGAQTVGRETAAQWLRVAFHDFVTANVSAGTGGVDASIGFETLRVEDSGSAFNDSFAFFMPYVNAQVSMADLVAISVVMAVGNCGGPQIPMRGGRIDATGPGASGVPAPDTDLATTLGFFASSGFNQVDSIGLTACGHTMGSVHHGGFPTVIGPSAVTPNNTAGGIHFDDTVDVFDDHVVQQYVSSTGQQGGPLVTSFNVSSRSDLRLYESDGNATMIRLAAQGSGFLSICNNLLQRMIETVPNGVVLFNAITPQTVKPVNATLDLDALGNLIFSGKIRILSGPGATAPTTITLSYARSASMTLSPYAETGTSVFGTTSFYPFVVMMKEPWSFDRFSIAAGSIGRHVFKAQADVFVIPSLTFLTSSTSTSVNITVAVRSDIGRGERGPEKLFIGVNVSAPVPQRGTLAPKVQSWTIQMSKSGNLGDYELWGGFLDLGVLSTRAVTIDAIVEGEVVDKVVL